MPSDIPHISEVCKNWAEAAAIVVGGLWTLWVFRYEARANMPSLDGDLSVESTVLSRGEPASSEATSSKGTGAAPRLAVSVCALWNNRSKFPVKLNQKCIAVHAYIIPANLPDGSDLSDHEVLTEVGTRKPYEDKSHFTLEPKSQSTLRVHFILVQGPVYLFRWKLKSINRFTWMGVKKLMEKRFKGVTWEDFKKLTWRGLTWEKEIIWNSAAETAAAAKGRGTGEIEKTDESDET
jgi:hypothetical protein